MRQEEQITTQQMIKQNYELTRKLGKDIKKIKVYMALQTLTSILWILVIVVPIILAVIYLPPILKPYAERVMNIYQMSNQTMDYMQKLK